MWLNSNVTMLCWIAKVQLRQCLSIWFKICPKSIKISKQCNQLRHKARRFLNIFVVVATFSFQGCIISATVAFFTSTKHKVQNKRNFFIFFFFIFENLYSTLWNIEQVLEDFGGFFWMFWMLNVFLIMLILSSYSNNDLDFTFLWYLLPTCFR